jgi:hypothetical protein
VVAHVEHLKDCGLELDLDLIWQGQELPDEAARALLEIAPQVRTTRIQPAECLRLLRTSPPPVHVRQLGSRNLGLGADLREARSCTRTGSDSASLVASG